MHNIIAIMILLLSGCSPASPAPPTPDARTVVRPRIVAEHPHDPHAYTEGLFMRDGQLWESTGQEGSSDLRKIDPASGRIIQRVALPPADFGEGSVDWNGQIVSLTWRTGRGYRWDARTLRRISTFSYAGEGWGLTRNGDVLVMSDGTSDIVFRDAASFAEKRRIHVTFRGQPVPNLNELEWIDGQIWANVWTTSLIARIDPSDGRIVSWVDLSEIAAKQPSTDPDAVANGIAWDPASRHVYVTGKHWTKVYEIVLD